MKSYIASLFILILSTIGYKSSAQNLTEFQPKEVYTSTDLIILQIGKNSFQHISFLQTNDFGNVPCNGLVLRNNNDAVIFDTPTSDKSAAELIKWVEKNLHCKIKAIVPTHFHEDCLGGLNSFHRNNISPLTGFTKQLDLLKKIKPRFQNTVLRIHLF
jgi:metallo-beta-lactamase class B